MVLQLINTGTAANDGTGDTLRSAGQKMNDNSSELYGLVADTQGALGEKLEAADIAAFESTSQLNARDTANRARANHTGTQSAGTIIDFAQAAAEAAPVQSVAGKTGLVSLAKGDVGLGQVDNTGDAFKPISTATQAALDLKVEEADLALFETNAQLNARDTANRARASHTGTQAASTITGLAAVATSGAYGDLTEKPITGINYDQQAEPSSPSVGQVWRERSSGGLIVGEWQWDSEALRWVELTIRSQSFTAAGTGQIFHPFSVASGLLNPFGTILYLGWQGIFWINTTADSSNYYQQRIMTAIKDPVSDSTVNGNAYILQPEASALHTAANTNIPFSVPTKRLLSYPSGFIGFRLWVTVVGAPGSFRYVNSVLFKNVRAL